MLLDGKMVVACSGSCDWYQMTWLVLFYDMLTL